MIEQNVLFQYDRIFVTDLALYTPALDMVANSQLKSKVDVFDHHKRAVEDQMNCYSFTMITEEYNGQKCCGTSLFYQYLVSHHLLNRTASLDEFVELVRLEDTWEWKKNLEVGEKAHDLATLLNAIGKEAYPSLFFKKLENHTDAFELDLEEKRLIKEKKEEYAFLLNHILSTAEYFYDEFQHRFGAVFADYEYRNELVEKICKDGNPNMVDYFIIVAMNKGLFGQKSYRCVVDGIDVNEIAMRHGGGGHPSAASVNITEEQKIKALSMSRRDALKYLVDSCYTL